MLPGSANRIIVMAEREQEHRHHIEKVGIDSQIDIEKSYIKSVSRGQIVAAIFAFCVLTAVTLLGISDHDWLAGIMFTALAGIIGVLTYQHQKSKKK